MCNWPEILAGTWQQCVDSPKSGHHLIHTIVAFKLGENLSSTRWGNQSWTTCCGPLPLLGALRGRWCKWGAGSGRSLSRLGNCLLPMHRSELCMGQHNTTNMCEDFRNSKNMVFNVKKRYSYKTSFHKTSRHETSSHKTSRLQNVPAYKTSHLQNVLVYKTSSSTKRPRLQNVLVHKTSCLQKVLAYKTSSPTKRPSTKRPSLSLGLAAIYSESSNIGLVG